MVEAGSKGDQGEQIKEHKNGAQDVELPPQDQSKGEQIVPPEGKENVDMEVDKDTNHAKNTTSNIQTSTEGVVISKPVLGEKDAGAQQNPAQNSNDLNYEDYVDDTDWDKQLEKAIQYSNKKVMPSLRKSTRGTTKKEESLTLESIKEKILELEEDYTETATALNKAWAPTSIADGLKQVILEAEDEETIAKALLKVEEGFSNPMHFKPSYGATTNAPMEVDGESRSNASSKDFTTVNKIIEGDTMFYRSNRKIKKFWSTDTLKEAWIEYLADIQPGSISALFMCVCIFVDQAEAYIDKLNEKVEKKKAAEEKSNKDKGSKKSSKYSVDRLERKRKAGFYKESSEEESEDESKPPSRRNKRVKTSQHESEFDEESAEVYSDEELEEDEDEAEGDQDEDSQWDSHCYICNKPGEVIC